MSDKSPNIGNHWCFPIASELLRDDLFPTKEDVSRGDGRLNKMMIRNRKSDVTNTKGERIFRGIAPAKIKSCKPTDEEVEFYEALLDYVRKGYSAADRLAKQDGGKANAIGFLMSTFRKLASSSRAAIKKALENWLQYLQNDEAPAQTNVTESEKDDR